MIVVMACSRPRVILGGNHTLYVRAGACSVFVFPVDPSPRQTEYETGIHACAGTLEGLMSSTLDSTMGVGIRTFG